jgi:hypothetical protein
MAEIRPLKALHYSLDSGSSLGDVVAPPYDVIDAETRKGLLERSPFNVVEIDLPESPGGGDRYAHAAETLEAWTLEGVLAADREPALWALEQDYEGMWFTAHLLLPCMARTLSPSERHPNVTHRAERQRMMKKAARWCSGPKEKSVCFQRHRVKTACCRRRWHVGDKIKLPPCDRYL